MISGLVCLLRISSGSLASSGPGMEVDQRIAIDRISGKLAATQLQQLRTDCIDTLYNLTSENPNYPFNFRRSLLLWLPTQDLIERDEDEHIELISTQCLCGVSHLAISSYKAVCHLLNYDRYFVVV